MFIVKIEGLWNSCSILNWIESFCLIGNKELQFVGLILTGLKSFVEYFKVVS